MTSRLIGLPSAGRMDIETAAREKAAAEMIQKLAGAITEAGAEIGRLRTLLASVEWVCVEGSYGEGVSPPTCPVCSKRQYENHAPDCALAASIPPPTATA